MRRPVLDRRPFVIGISLCLLLFLVLCLLSRDAARYAVAAITPVFAFFAFLYLKKMPFSSVHRRAVLFVTLLVAVLYTVLCLLSGLYFGFFLADVAFSFRSLLSYILPITITVISIEITRCAFLGQKGFFARSVAYVIGTLSEVLLVTSFSAVTNFYHFMDLMGATLLPALAAQPLYQYTGKHYGIWPAISFRLVTSLAPFLIPIRSGMPDSLSSFVSILLPPALLFLLRLLYGKTVKTTEKRRVGKWLYATVVSALIFVTSFMMLISNEFRFGLLIIATDSMTGSINKGDAVIFEEYTGQFVDEQDVIVFYHNDRVTVHRIVDISRVNGRNRYFTQGDANDYLDSGYATDADIIGVVKGKIPYFGYPTLWLRGMFN